MWQSNTAVGAVVRSWMGALLRLACLAFACHASCPASAADIEIVRKQLFAPDGLRGSPSGCNVRLRGLIQVGDLAQLQAAYAVAENGQKHAPSFLCLDSPGGNYREGLLILRWLLHPDPQQGPGISTVIEDGAACYSSCALIFMGGSVFVKFGRHPLRWLHSGGHLGFHAPYLEPSDFAEKKYTKDELLSAFQAARKSGTQLLAEFNKPRRLVVLDPFAEPWVSADLLYELMLRGPKEMFLIDTVDKAGRFGIRVFGLPFAPKLTRESGQNVCKNAMAWTGGQYSADIFSRTDETLYLNRLEIQADEIQADVFDQKSAIRTLAFWSDSTTSTTCIVSVRVNNDASVDYVSAILVEGGYIKGEYYEVENYKSKVTIDGDRQQLLLYPAEAQLKDLGAPRRRGGPGANKR